MAKRPITIQLEPELIDAIDSARGELARQEWIAAACRLRLRPAPSLEHVDVTLTTKPLNRADIFRQATQRKGK